MKNTNQFKLNTNGLTFNKKNPKNRYDSYFRINNNHWTTSTVIICLG